MDLSKVSPKEAGEALSQAAEKGESFGGLLELKLTGVPSKLGQPVFQKIKSDFTSALMGIGAVNAVEIGEGFDAALAQGQEFHSKSNVYGGIRGGITTGQEIKIKISFKPTSSIKDIARQGRHDPCIVPRAIPVAESMCHLVIADHILLAATDKMDYLKRIYHV
jgi:chorismate synthase